MEFVCVDPRTLEPRNRADEINDSAESLIVPILSVKSSRNGPARKSKSRTKMTKPKEPRKHEKDPTDPKLTAKEKKSIKKAIACKAQRDKKDAQIREAEFLRGENMQLKEKVSMLEQEKQGYLHKLDQLELKFEQQPKQSLIQDLLQKTATLEIQLDQQTEHNQKLMQYVQVLQQLLNNQ